MLRTSVAICGLNRLRHSVKSNAYCIHGTPSSSAGTSMEPEERMRKRYIGLHGWSQMDQSGSENLSCCVILRRTMKSRSVDVDFRSRHGECGTILIN
ncbi:hypothetical protein XENOCAPTIV_004154 [Xenoophorus captivus]|uniref:Uncharacterized protein n=1 Tax=Xenoophorus captivus TaxID=1517983 RepID=A0ABV0QPU4_9TELE